MADPLAELAERVVAALAADPPHVIGIGGAVAVGKSTVAAGLARLLTERGRRVDIVATDAFLLPNMVLQERNITFRKGFPESFDIDAIMRFLSDIRSGSKRVTAPVYSHAMYDIVTGEESVISNPDVVLLEGVIALQPPVVEAIDVPIYIDAAEADVREWFVTRFEALTDEARSDPSSFYRMFVDMSRSDLLGIAERTWDSINAINLREHIAPSKDRAMFVVSKAKDHSIRTVIGP